MSVRNQLHFMNHASFAIERDSELLLADPWYQGAAFHNGWELLDKSTSDASIIDWLKRAQKKVYLWYSHEHSDHLSISFLKTISKEALDLTVIFQKTLDGRVISLLNELGLSVIEAEEGRTISIGEGFDVTTWPYRGGDSFCLIRSNEVSLLNVNDCVIATEDQARFVKSKYCSLAPRLDILLTQFGYANWAGNEADIDQRIELANQKIDRIRVQDKVLNPAFVIPFASFVFFCHQENFYLNDAQNSPADIILAPELEPLKTKIFFLQPYDQVDLNAEGSLGSQLGSLSESAVQHWGALKDAIQPTRGPENEFSLSELMDDFSHYRRHVCLRFAAAPLFLEVIRFVKPLKIRITDIGEVVTLSYLKGMSVDKNSSRWHLSMTSEVLSFILKNDFGFNAVRVNGRFRLGQGQTMADPLRFFIVQDYIKNGYGVSHPIKTGKFLLLSEASFLHGLRSAEP